MTGIDIFHFYSLTRLNGMFSVSLQTEVAATSNLLTDKEYSKNVVQAP